MIRALTLIVIGAATFAAVYFLTPPKEPPASPPATSAPPKVDSSEVEIAAAPPPEEIAPVHLELRPGAEPLPLQAEAPPAIRNVTPDTMTAGPRVTGTVVRADPPPPPPPQARTQRLFNPMVIAAGTIKVREREIHLAGIEAPKFETMCGEGAAAWPCGRMARAALRSFIRGRAIECEIPAGAKEIPDPAECVVGGDHIAEWLVAQGWAKRSGETFASEEKTARDARLGLWGDRRPEAQVASGG